MALRAARAVGDGVRDGAPAADVRASLTALEEALRRLARSAEETRALGRCSPPSSEGAVAIEVYPLARAAVAELAKRFPQVEITCRASSPRAESAGAAIGGGHEGLRRILEIVVTNACEGDGARGASRVEVLITDEPQLRLVTLEVRDDGPGFPPSLLAGPIEAFGTTKLGASGLGLYTAERLARAGGGFLRRENGAGGGGRVTVFLPAVDAA
jgi:signal transduction histidine kinase